MSYQSGFYEYGLSPFHMKATKGFFNPGAFKFFKRTGRQAMFIVPPAILFFYVKGWADKKVRCLIMLPFVGNSLREAGGYWSSFA